MKTGAWGRGRQGWGRRIIGPSVALGLWLGVLAGAPLGAAPPPATVIERVGMLCPTGYLMSGAYCMPGRNARHAIRRSGLCPPGYLMNGDYCLAEPNATHVLPRTGICPPGYSMWGDYCIAGRSRH
jgi:hypothetical protein